MTLFFLRTLTAGLALTGFSAVGQVPLATPSTDDLLTKIQRGRLSQTDLWNLERQPSDSRTIPILKAAFQSRIEKKERQWIAATLLRLEERAGPYFDFLAAYAIEAIEDRTPPVLKHDSNGHSIRGEFSPAFEKWCAENGKDPRAVATIQLHDYPEDVLMLAQVDDPRARDLFRRGLESPNFLIVAYCVQGLGRLNDSLALSLIVRAVGNLTSDEGSAIAMQLPWFGSPDAANLMERIIPNQKLRDFHRNMVQQQRLSEFERIRTRIGLAKQK